MSTFPTDLADIDFNFEFDSDFEDDASEEEFEASEREQVPPQSSEPTFSVAALGQLTEEELEDIKIIDVSAKDTVSTLAFDFLSGVLQDYKTHGVGYKNYVIKFNRTATSERVDMFKRAFTVRISRIRKEAAKSHPLEKFYVTFIRLYAVEPDATGASRHWFCTIARMNEAQYQGYAKERAIEQRQADVSTQLMQKSIGVL